jgi:histidinol-phosphatase (PHP family)
VQILKNLKEEYKHDIEIYIGFEAEYIPEFHEKQVEMCRRLDCDYMIMGQHFLSGEIGTAYMGNVTSSEKILEAYVNSVLEGAETGRFMYIAHPDLIHYEGDEKIYEKHMRRLCEKLNQMDVPLEINNLGMAGNRHYPTERFWKIAGEIGNTAVIGLDAHSVHDMENIDAYKRCIEIVKKCSINLLTESKDVIKYMWESRKILHNKPTK